jgi:hypothetical protein
MKPTDVQNLREAYASMQEKAGGDKKTDTKKDWANNPGAGVLGQLERARRKIYGTEREKRQAHSYEKSVDTLSKGKGAGQKGIGKDGKRLTADQISAETARRRKADPKYKAGKNQADNTEAEYVKDAKAKKTKPETKTKPKEKTTSGLSKEQQAKLSADVERRRKSGEMSDLRGGNDKVDGYGKAKNNSGGGGGGDRDGGGGGRKTGGASDSRNAEYTKKRSAIAKAKSPEDKAKATKDAESAGMAAWRKANPKLAAAKDKRDKTRGTEKSSNPLMKKYLKDRESRKAGNEKARRDAKADSIAQSPNADKINKKETAIKDNIKSTMKKQALSDRAKAKAGQDPSKPTPKDQLPKGAQQARTGVPKAEPKGSLDVKKSETPKSTSAATAPAQQKKVQLPASAPKGSTLMSTSAAKGSSGGYQTPAAAAPKAATPKMFSKGGKYRKESLMSFGAYQLSEKKTSVKINPKLKDLEEDLLSEGSCSGHSEGGEIVNGRCSVCGGTPKKSTKKEETAYVSQEEVSEESYQEGYETETDLTEAPLPGSTNKNYYDSKKDFKNAFKSDPGAFKSALPSMGGRPGGTMPRGRPGLYSGKDAYRPMPAFQQKMMFNSKIGQKLSGGKGFWKSTMKANNAVVGSPNSDGNKPKPSQNMNLNRPGGPSSSSGGSNKPMNANRPSSAPKANTSGLSGKKPSDLLSKGGKVKKPVSEMTQQEIHEEYVQIQEFLGKVFKGVGNFVKGIFGGGQKQQQQPKQQSMKDYNPAKGVKLSGSMNDNRPKISNSTGSNQSMPDTGKQSGSKPSDIADIKSGTPEKVDKGLPNRKDKKKDKRFDEEVECTSEYIGPEERTKMKNDIILAKRAMRASNAAKAKAMSDNERILKSLGKFGKTTPEECDK